MPTETEIETVEDVILCAKCGGSYYAAEQSVECPHYQKYKDKTITETTPESFLPTKERWKMSESESEIVARGPYANGMFHAACMLPSTDQQIRLACGEMTAQEMRTIKAVLEWKKNQIIKAAKADNGHGF